MSSMPSYRSIMSLSKLTPTEMALSKTWFNGKGLRVLVRVRRWRRELRLLGFAEEVSAWVDEVVERAIWAVEKANGKKIKVCRCLCLCDWEE